VVILMRVLSLPLLVLVLAACPGGGSDPATSTDPPPREAPQEAGSAAEFEASEPTTEEETPAAPRIAPTEATAAEVLGSAPEGVGLAPGATAPDVTAADTHGDAVRLRGLLEEGPVLVVFYRGGWCPYCNSQIRELAVAHPELARRGVTPVAVSVDRPEEGAKTRAAYSIPFPVVSDPDLAWHRGFGVTLELGDDEVARLSGFGIDLEASSGRDHQTLAVPSVFIVDASGVVRWRHVHPDYRQRPTTAQLLAVIDGLAPSLGE